MYHYIFLLLIGFSFIDTSGQESQTKVIDGLTNDWNSVFSSINKDGKVSYSVSRDNTNLYLCFRTTDRGTQQKITRAGTILLLSAKGEKKVRASIAFPLKSDIGQQQRPQGQSNTNQGVRQDQNRSRQLQLERLRNMKIKGFNSLDGNIDHSISDIKTALSWNSETMLCYEIQIPFSEIYSDTFQEEDLNNPLQLKLTVNGISSPQNVSTGRNMSSGGRSGGRGGGGGRSSGGGMRPGSRGNAMSDMSVAHIYKAEIHLNNLKL